MTQQLLVCLPGRPDWLTVRATPWSDRIRPHFLNTKRTLFMTLPRLECL